MPERIHLRRTKGWRKPEGAVVVSRPTRWGNPWRVDRCSWEGCGLPGEHWHVYDDLHSAVRSFFTQREAASLAVKQYKRWITSSMTRADSLVPMLAGHDLACWCPLDLPCHADVLLALANRELS